MRWHGLLTCFILASACARPPDAQAIRTAIAGMGQAVEAHRSADILGHVSDDFTGNDGELDRAQLANLLRVELLAKRGLGVSLGSIDVELSGDRATANFDATLSDDSGRWIPDHRSNVHFTTAWRREGGEWRCYNAKWSSDAR